MGRGIEDSITAARTDTQNVVNQGALEACPDFLHSRQPGVKGVKDDSGTPAILLVDGSVVERRVLSAMLHREQCAIIEAGSGAEALDALAKHRIDLIVLDRAMPGMDGIDCCRTIRSNRAMALVPVMMLSGAHDADSEIAGIRAGANEFVGKPVHPEVFRTRVRALLRHKTAIDRLEETETILFALAQAVEKRDHYTSGHCERLAIYGVEFGTRLGLSRADLLALHRGGYLHDIGKIAVPDAILFKPDRLDTAERLLMQTHTIRGEEICHPLRSIRNVLPIVRSHHERWDGSGYPDALRGHEIPLLARVLQMADVYDALTTVRPYKGALDPAQALQVMREEAAKGWYDPELMREFSQLRPGSLDNVNAWIEEQASLDDFQFSLRNIHRQLTKW